jgi:RNA polymerase sigma-70 factor (ECF subfamily)
VCTDCPARLARDVDAAFEDFVTHHQDLVYGVALRLSGQPPDAEDLAQEAFVRAYRWLRTSGPARIADLQPRGWLATIVLNLGRNRARRPQPGEAALDLAPEPAADPRDRPDQLAEAHETVDEWRARLERLPARYRLAVELRHVHGLSYAETAQALGRPTGTVKSDVHRGVRLLREAWLHETSSRRSAGERAHRAERGQGVPT